MGSWVLLFPLPSGLQVEGHGDGLGDGVKGGVGWGLLSALTLAEGYHTGAVWDDNQSSLLSALWGVRAGWGQGRSPRPHLLPYGCLGTAGACFPLPPQPALFPRGCVPTRPIFMWAPCLPGGLLIPPKRAGELLTELPYPLNKQARARSCCRIKRHPFAAVAPAPKHPAPPACPASHEGLPPRGWLPRHSCSKS